MSYSKAGVEKFTIIDDLPDIDDLESGSSYNGGPPRPDQPSDANLAKYIRNNHSPNNNSGMNPQNMSRQMPISEPMNMGMVMPPQPQMDQLRSVGAPTCLDIAEHVANCPVCSKLYNNDKTVYIFAIVVLIIICLLLLKRVLE